MKKVFLMSGDPALRSALADCAGVEPGQIHAAARWEEARDVLFKQHFDAAFIDYDAMKIEGLDAFILLDNILQKERTPGVLILREASPRAQQFIESLSAFQRAVTLHGQPPSPGVLRGAVDAALAQPAGDPAADASPDSPVLVQVHLSTDTAGNFAQIGLSRSLYTLALAGPSGVLSLTNGALKQRYAIVQGRPHQVGDERFGSLEHLASAFAWPSGTFEFTSGQPPQGEAAEPWSFIYQGITRHMPSRAVMQALMPQMKTYPTPTDLWAQRRDALSGLAHLEALMGACDGEQTLERVLAAMGAQVTQGFQAMYFAVQTDLLVLRSQPTPQGVCIQYNREITRFQQQQVEEQVKGTKAYRARGAGRVSLERELGDFLSHLERATPYEIFDVWEGCGRKVVQTKFYELVKAHHPDVYGGNISGDVKRLAQEVFIVLKDTYQALLKLEAEQTRPRPASMGQAGASAQFSVGDDPSFASESVSGASAPPASAPATPGAPTTPPATAQTAAARQSRIDRLRVKRAATPIGLAREPAPERPAPSEAERRASIERIRTRSTPGLRSTTGNLNAADIAQNAFNEGYSAWRESNNVDVAAERFATAYNLAPNSGKYMTFYGYFLFLRDASTLEQAQQILRKAIELKDRQSLPDAHLFLGHLLKVQGKHDEALQQYQLSLKLNPTSRAAQREIRLYERRQKGSTTGENNTGFLKNLFKK